MPVQVVGEVNTLNVIRQLIEEPNAEFEHLQITDSEY